MRRSFDQFGLKFDLTGTQISVINFISKSPDLSVNFQDIEKEFNIKGSTASVLIKRMEKKGFIYFKTLPNDARKKSIHLTEKSQNVCSEISVYLDTYQVEVEKRFTSHELECFDRVITFFINLED